MNLELCPSIGINCTYLSENECISRSNHRAYSHLLLWLLPERNGRGVWLLFVEALYLLAFRVPSHFKLPIPLQSV